MPSQASPYPPLPTPAAALIGAAAMAASGAERVARTIAVPLVGPLRRLTRRAPGVGDRLDATIGALADGGAAVAQRSLALAESAVRGVLRAVLPIVFQELAALAPQDLTAVVLKHVDLDAVATQIDIDALLARLDLPGLVHQVIAQLDLTRLVLEQVDMDAIAAGLDLDGIIARVDIDKVIAGVDLDAAVHQVDLLGLANEIIEGVNLPEIIRESTGALSTDAVRGVRTRGVDADAAVSGFVDRLLGRGEDA